ncbi:MAG: hypothetical protein ACRENK_07880 [Gemmatimonadaceae bacterium]
MVPSWRQRLFEMQRALAQNQPEPIALNQGMMMGLSVVGGVIMTACVVWFLIRNRAVFVRASIS